MMKKIGFIVNPIAGLCGKAGFKGSDNADNQKRALNDGYEKTAFERAKKCIERVKNTGECTFIAPLGEMGGDVLEAFQISYQKIEVSKGETSREDTMKCLSLFQKNGVDLIVFCGGDGTARDVCEENKDNIPVLGVPAGVKMYSGCFALGPQVAGDILNEYIEGKHFSLELREVMDLDEEFLGQYEMRSRLYGYLPTLQKGESLQGTKSVSTVSPEEAEILTEYIASKMRDDVLYIVGPGSTTYQLKKRLCGEGTLIGVDAFQKGRMVRKDADEKELIRLIKENGKAEIIVTCIGGAGYVFGRGNQQISARVIGMVGKENLRLAVTKSKLASLKGRPMYVDTGDKKMDNYLSGYYQIYFSRQESAFYKMQSP